MYYDYFGLKDAPFSIAPNPEYLFMTARHQEALAHLYHGIKSDAGFVLLTGDIGTGKTTICRCFLSELPDNVAVAYILNPFLGGRELLMTICEELNIKNVDKKSSLRSLTQHIHKRLLENHAKGLTTILLIDEAQHINLKVLELIRLLTNLETNKQKLFKIILVGQPELNEHIEKPELVQLAQRITARYHIKSLNSEEISTYINYRLNIAGSIDGVNIFPPKIIKTIYKMTEGVPRIINALCDRALLGVYSQNKRQVDKTILNVAYKEIRGKDITNGSFTPLPQHWLLLALLLIAVALGSWFLSQKYHGNQNLPAGGSSPISSSSNSSSSTLDATSNLPNEFDGTEVKESLVNKPILPQFIYTNATTAIDELIRGLYIPNQNDIATCAALVSLDWRCENISDVELSTLAKINRPAVMVLSNGAQTFYVPVVAKQNQQLGVLQSGNISWVNIADLEPLWQRQMTFLWQPPAQFIDYIYFDSEPNLINWLANAFVIIDEQAQPLAKDAYNSLLKQRVSLFQENYNLTVDGIVGRDTILRINEVLGIAKVLERPELLGADIASRSTVFNQNDSSLALSESSQLQSR